ncbi:MAG: hypothetical protein QW699_04520 [Metallosphaera sp.]
MGLKWYYWVGIIVFIILGVSTLVPAPTDKTSLLGYKTLCPLAPVSTAVCWAIAGAIYWLGRRRVS